MVYDVADARVLAVADSNRHRDLLDRHVGDAVERAQ